MSKRELAEVSGISLSTIYGIEDGLKHDVYVGTVRKLARALKTTAAHLLQVPR